MNPLRGWEDDAYIGGNGTTYYCDPVSGKLSNDGRSPGAAWSSLEDVLTAGYFKSIVKGGDTVLLLSGNHGYAQFSDLVYDDWVTVSGAPGEQAGLKGVRGYSIEKLSLEHLWVTPLLADQFFQDGRGLIWIGRSNGSKGVSRNVAIRNCRVFSVLDSSQWSPHDWAVLASQGVTMYEVDDGIIEHNFITNVYTGIGFNGNRIQVRANWVDNFAGDGMFGGGKEHLVEDNLITDVYEDDTGFHNDGIQFYYAGGGNSATLRRNVIVATIDPSRAPSIHLQGITSFQEDFSNSLVENNYVISDTTHGISFTGGGSNSTFINNTIYGFRDGDGSPMRLNGTWTNSLARNNLVTNMFSDAPHDHNLIIKNPAEAPNYFVDPDHLGFRLRDTSPAIDAGADALAPLVDFEGDVRPQGAHTDIGADESR
ncbi:MAG: right-handed parallel beta-helix repeat-containing protein [Planctomycetota bacterium]